MHKRFILLLGVFLDSHVPTPGQMPAPEIVSAQELIVRRCRQDPIRGQPGPAQTDCP
jgi:hypothetical protein